ncbi:MAG TPA: ABC transporter ATP-binding protein [Dehalococcoidales bacterium]|nr:ABC transporter ATP-binding protein [Dehalococcoidales bacterium]
MRILEGAKVCKSFGGLAAVSNVDFHLEKGEILGLIGPNGSGKTTLFNLISGALVTKSGKVSFKERCLTGLSPFKICRAGVARTFQSVKIFGDMTVIEHVLLALQFGGASRVKAQDVNREARGVLDFVGLAGTENILARNLTLSKQKRLEVARALATRPEVLMLDEVMAGLNPTEVSEAMNLVKKIRDSGVTVVMIEHVMKAIMGICDRIMVLNYGQVIAEGTPQEIAKNKNVIAVYLGE